jgi:hypothetical protein
MTDHDKRGKIQFFFFFIFLFDFASEQAVIGHANANVNCQFLNSALLKLLQIKYQNTKNSPFDSYNHVTFHYSRIFLWSSFGGNDQSNASSFSKCCSFLEVVEATLRLF